MQHPIDPTIDCVFKAILGSEQHKGLLIDFLNAILAPDKPIVTVELLNPYNEREFLGDKLSIVDVKAQDEQQRFYQIEIQLAAFPSLTARMLYNWSTLYRKQVGEGELYPQLNGVTAIWLLAENLPTLAKSAAYHHHFEAWDRVQQQRLSDHLHIHVLELNKWQLQGESLDNKAQWLYFFREGRHIDVDDPPTLLQHSPIMKEAMMILRQFSEQELDYFRYQNRLDYLRQQRTIESDYRHAREALRQSELEKQQLAREKTQAEQEKQQLAREKTQAEQEKQQLAREKQQLLELLKQHGIMLP